MTPEQTKLIDILKETKKQIPSEGWYHVEARINSCIEIAEKLAVQAEPEPPHPIQPLMLDKQGVIRFKKNAIVSFLTSKDQILNTLALMDFSDEDRQQLAQLIGYSLSGYGDLSYVTDEAYERAEESYEGKGNS